MVLHKGNRAGTEVVVLENGIVNGVLPPGSDRPQDYNTNFVNGVGPPSPVLVNGLTTTPPSSPGHVVVPGSPDSGFVNALAPKPPSSPGPVVVPGSPGSDRQSVLDAYGIQVSHTVGNGSYAVVKAAFSTKHKSKVAVKIVQKNKAPRDYIEKFLPREIELIKVLRHPNLVCFLQSIETTNRVYLVMELAEGGDLLDVMNRQRYVKEAQAAIWFHQMVEGIGYCHSKGVVHRDLKCENVLLDRNNHVKITDFGFARANLTKPDGTRVLSRTYCGSYSYAAPEVLTGTPYDPFKSDIWSMGVILYIMVFGKFPFDDTNHKVLLKQVQSRVKFPPDRDWVSAECKTLLDKIFQPIKTRVTIEEIRRDKWYQRLCIRDAMKG